MLSRGIPPWMLVSITIYLVGVTLYLFAPAPRAGGALSSQAAIEKRFDRLEFLVTHRLAAAAESQAAHSETMQAAAAAVVAAVAATPAAAAAIAKQSAPTAYALASSGTIAPPAAKRGKRLVTGLAKGIEADLLYRFVRSLRQHTSPTDTDIVLFLHAKDAPANSPLLWALEAYGVQVIRFDPDTFADVRWRKYHPSSYRWLLIRSWMLTQPTGLYEAVLFADVRDAFFAADPFAPMHRVGSAPTTTVVPTPAATTGFDRANAAPLSPAFYAFLEAKPRTIAECGWNSGWVKDCFGDAGLKEVGARVISCSGTSIGTWAAASTYAALMAEEISKNPCERNGVDQGMHNYFVFSGKLQKALGAGTALVEVTNEDGWVGTVQSMPTLTRDRAGRLLNDKGQVYALIHQYDRSLLMREQLQHEFTWMEPSKVNK